MIDVLLATYNGGKYLPELLESLDRQTFTDWRLIVGDDGSTDDTVALLEAWGRENPGRLSWRPPATGLGACGNFAALMEVSEAPYFMFCDQDDVWLPEKMALLLKEVRAAEETYGRETPMLVHSDLIVVDEQLNTITDSFWKGQNWMWPDFERPWKTLILQNVVTGCAMIGNASLRRASLPISAGALMHDWWVALTAAALGRIVPMDKPTVLYRQHGTNAVGYRAWTARKEVRRLIFGPISEYKRLEFSIRNTRKQVRQLIDAHGCSIGAEPRCYFKEYCEIEGMNFIDRKMFLIKHKLWYDDVVRNLGLIIFI